MLTNTEPPPRPSLRSFLDDLQVTLGETPARVSRTVDPKLELSAVVKSLEAASNPVLLFESVGGSQLPVITGITATRERIACALRQPVDRCAEHLNECMRAPASCPTVGDAPVQEVVELGPQASLDRLPICTHATDDGGPFLTAAVMLVRDPSTGRTNAGIYRTMMKGARRLTVNAGADHDLARIVRATPAGAAVEFALVIGGHPSIAIASQAKNTTKIDSLELAGALAGSGLAVVPARTVDLLVPADAEIVIEGRLEPGSREPDGPFPEFTYYYGSGSGWVAEVTAITRRADAIFVDLHPAHVEHRCLWLFPGREARLLSQLQAAVGSVRAVHLPQYGAAMSAYITIEKRQEGEQRRALLAAFASDSYIKHAFAFDPDIDIRDPEQVLWALNVRFQADRDLFTVPFSLGVATDPSAYDSINRGDRGTLSTRAGFDVTLPLRSAAEPRADLPAPQFAALDPRDYLA